MVSTHERDRVGRPQSKIIKRNGPGVKTSLEWVLFLRDGRVLE